MKTIALYISLLLCVFTTLNAAETVKKEERNLASFSSIHAGSAFVVYLSQGSDQQVVVETEEKYVGKIETTVKNGTLYVGLKDLQGRNNHDLKTLHVYVTIPDIKNIAVSSAVKVKVQTPIKSNGSVSIKLSGASTLDDFTLDCKGFRLELSGASKSDVNLTCDNADIDLSGASHLKIGGKVGILNMNASGASKIDTRNLTYDKGDMHTSGTSRIRR